MSQLKPMAMSIALLSGGLMALPAQADFFDDSKASISLRNLYFNRDFRQANAAQSKADEWAQGVRAEWQSGYTSGRLGLGLDAIGLLGIKLDSSPDRSGTGILKRDTSEGQAMDEYSELGLTAKLRLDDHVLRLGTLLPQMPLAMHNDSRLLPQSFRGAWLQTGEWQNLKLDLGRFDRVNLRDSSNHERMTPVQGGARNVRLRNAGVDANAFDFAGLSWQAAEKTSVSWHYSELKDIYRQHYLTLGQAWQLDDDRQVNLNLRFADSSDAGRSNVDNRMTSLGLSYQTGMHRVSTSYQHMEGDTGFAYINGTDPFLAHLVQIQDFANRDERSWQVRHDYSFAELGLPGLKLMNRYTHGHNIEHAGGRGKEWERNTDVVYVIQNGALKNLSLHWRNATYRSNYASDMDENRLIIGYTFNL
ncbi:MAG: OprD family porin [Pseudomonas sp.]